MTSPTKLYMEPANPADIQIIPRVPLWTPDSGLLLFTAGIGMHQELPVLSGNRGGQEAQRRLPGNAWECRQKRRARFTT